MKKVAWKRYLHRNLVLAGQIRTKKESNLPYSVDIGKQKTLIVRKIRFLMLEVPDILIWNELLADMRKLADLYDYFKLTGARD